MSLVFLDVNQAVLISLGDHNVPVVSEDGRSEVELFILLVPFFFVMGLQLYCSVLAFFYSNTC